MLRWALVVIVAYFFGSIPFGYMIGRARGIDIRQHGSGNVGFTNVWRTLGIGPAAIVLACDAAKGYMAAALGFFLIGNELGALLGGVLAILGHTFSCFMHFKGGKGVATGAGVVLYISPMVLAICLMVVGILVALTKYMSLGTITAVALAPVLLYVTGAPHAYVFGIACAALYVIYLHIPNIRRLIQGTENKIGQKK